MADGARVVWHLLDGIDERAANNGLPPCLGFDLHWEGIWSVVWTTGYRRDLPWLRLPVLDRKGRLRHNGGIVAGHVAANLAVRLYIGLAARAG